jgi:predicted nucleic acid-binding protein
LERLADVVTIPEAVVAEVLAGPADDPARRSLEAGWGRREHVTLDADVVEWGLGAGETAVICLARKAGAVALLDDRAGRHAAKVAGVRTLGTVGIIVRAKRAGLIASAATLIDQMRECGLWLGPDIVAEALRLAGEQATPRR